MFCDVFLVSFLVFFQVNTVLDYNKLLYEYKETQHYMYAESLTFIEEYYSSEESRIANSVNSALNDNLNSITSAFQVT